MTTLNTIIEDEKSKLEDTAAHNYNLYLSGTVERADTGEDWTFEQAGEELKQFLTTAMQRAYEAGREENPLKGERRRIIEQIREERDAYWKEGLLQSIKETNFLKDMDKIEGDRGIVVYRRMRDHIEAFTLITNKDNLK